MAKEFFGTDGIRGVPGTPPLDDATLYATGRSLGAYLKREHGAARVLIGMDTRESGAHIASLLAAGLAQAGATVAFAGVITTPGVACLVRQGDFHAGVVISASHNPFKDNGVKLFSHAGMKFPDAVEEELEAGILKHRSEAAPKNLPPLTADESLDAEYLAFLRKRFIPGAKLSGFRIVLDCANGAAYKLGPELFRSLGADAIAMGVSPDGRNINAGCGSLHLEGLQQHVVAEKARLGVAFDGDADRALFVCESGKVVNGDGVLLAAARFLKSQNKLKATASWPLPCPTWVSSACLPAKTLCWRAPPSVTAMFLRKCFAAVTCWEANSPATSFFSTTAQPATACLRLQRLPRWSPCMARSNRWWKASRIIRSSSST